MGCEKEKSDVYLSNLVKLKKTTGNLFSNKPVFWDNGNFLITALGCTLNMYSVSTGSLSRELFQCSSKIILCQLHPTQASSLIAVTENGELTVYNLKTNEIECSMQLKLNQKFLNKQKVPKYDLDGKEEKNFNWEMQPLDSLQDRKFLHAEVKPFLNKPKEIFVWTTWCSKDENKCHLSVFTLNSGKHIRLFHIQKSGLQNRSLNFVLATVQNYEFFVGVSNSYLHLNRYDAQKNSISIRHSICYIKELTCLAFHPTECSFATGDSLGRIFIWRNIFEQNPLKELLHWHSLPVHDIFFSKFGNYLFSGGEENVLVKWSLNSHSKDFLPRLSSAIHHISGDCESSLLSLSLMDNKILIINFNFQNVSTVQHFSKWSVFSNESKQNICTVDPRSNSLVLNGKTGFIQFLSLNGDGKFIYTLDITNRNFITSDSDSNTENKKKIENTEVTHAKFNKDGRWLITAESRWEKTCKESRLKFWLYNERQSSFVLSTNVELPHDEYKIYSLEVSVEDMAITTGEDKKFRLWTPFEYEQAHKTKEFWAVYAIKNYRNLPCHGADFSKDASLVAVTFGPVLTIWETESCTPKCTLSVPHRKDDLKFCKFGNYELSHLVITSTEFNIFSWNLITLSMMWTVPLKSSLLISDPFSIYMCAFSLDNNLIIFNPSSPSPDLVLDNVSDYPVVAAHSVSNETGKLCMYFLTSNQDLFCLEDGDKTPTNTSKNTIQPKISGPLSAQIAEEQFHSEADKRKTVLLDKNNKDSVSSLLHSPAHTLPNPSLLCLDVLKGLLVFSTNRSVTDSSVKKVTNDVTKPRETPTNNTIADVNNLENKLLDIVKTIFV